VDALAPVTVVVNFAIKGDAIATRVSVRVSDADPTFASHVCDAACAIIGPIWIDGNAPWSGYTGPCRQACICTLLVFTACGPVDAVAVAYAGVTHRFTVGHQRAVLVLFARAGAIPSTGARQAESIPVTFEILVAGGPYRSGWIEVCPYPIGGKADPIAVDLVALISGAAALSPYVTEV